MEIVKERKQTTQHKTLRYLNRRMNLSDEDRRKLSNFEKGYIGEEKFDRKVKQHLSNEIMILNDLSMNYKGSLM